MANIMQLKKDWKEVEHPSGKYWYNKRTRETTRDMPLACAPGVAIASLVAEHGEGASSFEYCHHCRSTVMADVRYTALESGSACNNWLQKRCCPLCDGLLEYKAIAQALWAEPKTSTRARPEPAAKATPIARQESFARRLARKVVPSLGGEERAKDEDAPAADEQVKADPASTDPATSTEPAAPSEPSTSPVNDAATSSTRAKRLSLKRARLDKQQEAQSSADMKSPRLSASSDQIEMVVSTKVEGAASGATARFAFEPEIV